MVRQESRLIENGKIIIEISGGQKSQERRSTKIHTSDLHTTDNTHDGQTTALLRVMLILILVTITITTVVAIVIVIVPLSSSI